MYCAHCGKPVDDNAQFCQACGYPTRLGKKMLREQGKPVPGESSLPSLSCFSLERLDEKQKKIVIVAVAAVVVLGGGGAWYYHSHHLARPGFTTRMPAKQQTSKPQVQPKTQHRDPAKRTIESSGTKVGDPPVMPSRTRNEENGESQAAPAAGQDSGEPIFNGKNVRMDSPTADGLLTYFHKNITSHNLKEAYACFSPTYQGKVEYNGWASGYDTTVASIPEDVHVSSADGQHATVTFRLKAVDKDEDGGQKVQYFRGTCQLVKVNGLWKINDLAARNE